MQKIDLLRRDLLAGLGGFAIAVGLADQANAKAAKTKEITANNGAIHQEVAFAAAPSRLYEILTTASQFDKVVRASAAMSTVGPMLKAHPTMIDARPGGAFTLFGGYVSGFNLAMTPGAQLVQAWRAEDWGPNKYSIAQFALSADGAGTKLIFDHTGFPRGEAEHLVSGWYDNYWRPIAKIL